MIIVEQKLSDGSVKTGKLNLVDLAGSERVAKTNVNAKQLEEVKIVVENLLIGIRQRISTNLCRHLENAFMPWPISPRREAKCMFLIENHP